MFSLGQALQLAKSFAATSTYDEVRSCDRATRVVVAPLPLTVLAAAYRLSSWLCNWELTHASPTRTSVALYK